MRTMSCKKNAMHSSYRMRLSSSSLRNIMSKLHLPRTRHPPPEEKGRRRWSTSTRPRLPNSKLSQRKRPKNYWPRVRRLLSCNHSRSAMRTWWRRQLRITIRWRENSRCWRNRRKALGPDQEALHCLVLVQDSALVDLALHLQCDLLQGVERRKLNKICSMLMTWTTNSWWSWLQSLKTFSMSRNLCC